MLQCERKVRLARNLGPRSIDSRENENADGVKTVDVDARAIVGNVGVGGGGIIWIWRKKQVLYSSNRIYVV